MFPDLCICPKACKNRMFLSQTAVQTMFKIVFQRCSDTISGGFCNLHPGMLFFTYYPQSPEVLVR